MMGTADAIGSAFSYYVRSGFRHYADFSGRASRPAYWWWALFYVLIYGGLFVLGEVVGTDDPARRLLQIVSTIMLLALFLPYLSSRTWRLLFAGCMTPTARVGGFWSLSFPWLVPWSF